MPLASGTRLGPYEIVSAIGAGGMGEVYKAVDTRLGRTVALKVAREKFTERFQTEARAIASLNHPNICTLHDVGPDYLVMEHIEGSELRGPLPVPEALRIAIDIASGLAHAHKHGVVHRDLKPVNILVNKTGAKVLDFGIAKMAASAGATASATDTTVAVTQKGTIIGTPSYMAPEQLEGAPADTRTDVFAFGLILYEMLTGCRAFDGKTPASIIAAVLSSEPKPVAAVKPEVAPALDHVVSRCLAKDPEARWQTMQDVLLELKFIQANNSTPAALPHGSGHRRARWIGSGVLLVLAMLFGVLAFSRFRQPEPDAYAIRWDWRLPEGAGLRSYERPVVSPDGRKIAVAYQAPGAGYHLHVRFLESGKLIDLSGTDDAKSPFWSPDGRQIAFHQNGMLRRVNLETGTVDTICSTPPFAGGSWNKTGSILLGDFDGPLKTVSSSGGQLKQLRSGDLPGGSGQIFPEFLPDGRRFLFTAFQRAAPAGVYLGSINSNLAKFLVPGGGTVAFVQPGYLLSVSDPNLVARRFDSRTTTVGDPETVAEVDSTTGSGFSLFSSSSNGVLVHWKHSALDAGLVWYDRTGRRGAPAAEGRSIIQFTLSADEKKAALQERVAGGSAHISILDVATSIVSPFTTDATSAADDTPMWSPDSRQIVFTSSRNGRPMLFSKTVGQGGDSRILDSDATVYPGEWLKDGSLVVLDGKVFFRLVPGPNAKLVTLLKTDSTKDGPRVSPDGQWIAYNDEESGRSEVYVASFPDFTNRRQVSRDGGTQPRWRNDQRELFFMSFDGKIMAVPVQAGMQTGAPRTLFQTGALVIAYLDQYAVLADGRFLVAEPAPDRALFEVIMNWPALLKHR